MLKLFRDVKYYDKITFVNTWKMLFPLMVPVLISVFINNFFVYTDYIFLNVDKTKLFNPNISAIIIGYVNLLSFAVLGFFYGINVGFSALNAQLVSSNKKEQLEQALKLRFIFTLILGLIFLALVYFLASPIMNLLISLNDHGVGNKSSISTTDLLNQGTLFLKIYALNYLLQSFFITFNYFLREYKKQNATFYVIIVCYSVKLILNCIFILGLYNSISPTTAVAWSSVIASFSGVTAYFFIYARFLPFKIKLKHFFKFDIKLLIDFSKRAIVATINEALFTISSIVPLGLIALYGYNQFAGIQLGDSLFTLSASIFVTMGVCISIVISHYLGVNKLKEAKELAWYSLIISLLFSIFFTIILILLSVFVNKIFTGYNYDIQQWAKLTGILYGLSFTFYCINAVSHFIIRSGWNMVKVALLDGGLSVIFSCILPLVLILVLPRNDNSLKIVLYILILQKFIQMFMQLAAVKWAKWNVNITKAYIVDNAIDQNAHDNITNNLFDQGVKNEHINI